MKVLNRVLVVLCAALFLGSLPTRANHVDKGMSGLGDVNPTTGCSATAGVPCVIFNVLVPGQTATWVNFNSLGAGVEDGPYEFFEVPTTGPVTFQLTGSGVQFGSITCGFSAAQSFLDLNGFCTDIDETTVNPASFLVSNPLTPDANNQVTFSFVPGLSATLPDWVFYTQLGQGSIVTSTNPVTPVPEPASLFLLGSGLVAFGTYRRRRANREQAQETATQ